MPVDTETLRLSRELRTAVGGHADQVTRDLTSAWADAWEDLSPALLVALIAAATLAVKLGRWPGPWELARIPNLDAALLAVETALAGLAKRAAADTSAGAEAAIRDTVGLSPAIIASQLPAGEQEDTAAVAALAILATAVATRAVLARTRIGGVAASIPAAAMATVRRVLLAGVVVGADPRAMARNVLGALQVAFNSGLTRAIVMARTEILDAYRAMAADIRAANSRYVDTWIWVCLLDGRVCPSCLAMHGTVHPATEYGPVDHPQGRCMAVPHVKPWQVLGITLVEPADTIPDAEAWFWSLPEAQQIAIMGRTRLKLLRDRRIRWDDLATRQTNYGWRDTYVPTPVWELHRIAARRAAP